jgi:hypothetical protein
MKRVTLALFCGLLGIHTTGVASPPQVNGQTEIPKEKLVSALRTINTTEVLYRYDTGRFAHREELLAFLRKEGIVTQPPFDFENPKPYVLAVTTSPDGKHYQITFKPLSGMNDGRCRTAGFSDEGGVIFLGLALGCEESTR